MIIIERSALVGYSAQRMHALVDDFGSYPAFLPWCSGADVVERTGERAIATIHVNFRGIREQFTTENNNVPGQSIDIRLVRGPFRTLNGRWRFAALGDSACRIELRMEYEISSRLIERVIGPVFNYIANTLVDAFVRRAEELYGDE